MATLDAVEWPRFGEKLERTEDGRMNDGQASRRDFLRFAAVAAGTGLAHTCPFCEIELNS